MAKKTAKKTTKKTSKKSSKKTSKAASKKSSTASAATKKKVAKKATTKKTSKKTAKKTTTKKPAAKKTSKKVAKKTTKKTASKKTSTKSTTKKSTTKKSTEKKVTTKKSTSKKPSSKKKASTKKDTAKPTEPKAAPAEATTKAAETPAAKDDDKAPVKKFRSRSRKKNPTDYAPPPRPLLLGPGTKLAGKPLITSSKRSNAAVAETKVSKRTKTPFTPKQLDEYKLILLKKRSELVGDIEHLEDEALRSNTGETQTASNAAEFGTESFEQGLNLDLAAADRLTINEIDAALARIADRTYGLCIESREPIKKARLEEIPWAKYTVETARKHDLRFKR